jgi:hypothetical protein
MSSTFLMICLSSQLCVNLCYILLATLVTLYTHLDLLYGKFYSVSRDKKDGVHNEGGSKKGQIFSLRMAPLKDSNKNDVSIL